MENLIAQLDRHLRKSPALGRDVYIAKTAVVLGDVTLGDESSVWYGAVLRGDINRIEVGRGSNIQDNAVLHLSDDHPCVLGNHVTVGHSANVHACTIGDRCLIGMGATILAGDPSTMDPGGIRLPGVTRALAPMRHSSPMTAPSKIVAPMPIKHRSPMVQAWTLAE